MTDINPSDTPVKRGEARGWHHNPGLPIGVSPIFAWPPRPVAAVHWLAASWLQFSTALIILACALIGAAFLPSAETMKTLSLGWIFQIWLRTLILVTLVTGGLHLYFITFSGQGKALKFDPRDMARANKQFLFNHQVHENVFFALVSGVGLITAFEVLVHWFMANGWAPSFALTAEKPWLWLWFGFLVLVIPIWSSFHFYWVHRFLHWPPLYKLAHALHHKNVNVGPWSGISMHPVEHVLYFSTLLIHLVVPTHPILVVFHVCVQVLNPPFSHSGFEKIVIRDKEQLKTGDFFHQLHHRHFECNYGTAEFPWDAWFGSFDNGTAESRQRQRDRLKKLNRKTPGD